MTPLFLCILSDKSLIILQTGQRPALLLIPPDIVFRPPKSKMSNLSKKDYLGKAKVVSTVDGNSASGFEAPRKVRDVHIGYHF